jgi:hypothetical protein
MDKPEAGFTKEAAGGSGSAAKMSWSAWTFKIIVERRSVQRCRIDTNVMKTVRQRIQRSVFRQSRHWENRSEPINFQLPKQKGRNRLKRAFNLSRRLRPSNRAMRLTRDRNAVAQVCSEPTGSGAT